LAERVVPRTRPERPLVSVVVPVLDEAECVAELVRRVREAVEATGCRWEIVFVDDGSRDDTAQRVLALREGDPQVKLVRLTRSFGHQAALAAGLLLATGEVVVTMDGDLQHPPERLPELLEQWRAGADVVHTVRLGHTPTGGMLKDGTSRFFYRLMGMLSGLPMVPGGADFRLLDRRAVDAFNALPEHFVFVRGLVPWLGFAEARVEYAAERRGGGEAKFDFHRMIRLALDGIFSFSVAPLRFITLLGLGTTLFGVVFGIFSLVAWFLGNVEGRGWTSIVVLILVFGGVQLLSLGIVSEYVGRVYEEVKRRPRYVVESLHGLGERP
jgi:glycosyltransferase involved in cell wall biosynthesis